MPCAQICGLHILASYGWGLGFCAWCGVTPIWGLESDPSPGRSAWGHRLHIAEAASCYTCTVVIMLQLCTHMVDAEPVYPADIHCISHHRLACLHRCIAHGRMLLLQSSSLLLESKTSTACEKLFRHQSGSIEGTV